jgi:hypothetical protein
MLFAVQMDGNERQTWPLAWPPRLDGYQETTSEVSILVPSYLNFAKLVNMPLFLAGNISPYRLVHLRINLGYRSAQQYVVKC